MSLNMLSLSIIGSIIAAVMIVILFLKVENLIIERDQAIQYSLAKDDSIQYLQTKLGQAAAKSKVQDLTINNLRRLQEDKELAWIRQIEGVNRRLNNVEQISSTTAQAVGSFKMGLRDSIIYADEDVSKVNPISVSFFSFEDNWANIKGYFADSAYISDLRIDLKLQSVVYWERKHRFLGIRFGKKQWFQQTTTDNPYVTILDDQLIRVG